MRVETTVLTRDTSRYDVETNRVLELKAIKGNWEEAQGISKQRDSNATEWYDLAGRHISSVAFTKSPDLGDSLFPYCWAIVAMGVGKYKGLIENCL